MARVHILIASLNDSCNDSRVHNTKTALICYFQIVIEGTCSQTCIDIDDVSFSKETCSEIPWAPHQGVYQSN